MNKSHRELIRANYENACNDYLDAFCQKHGFSDRYWIANRIGEIADCNGFYSVDMADIRTDIDEDVEDGEFFRWYEYCIDVASAGLTAPNYHSWLRGCPRYTKEEIKAMQKP